MALNKKPISKSESNKRYYEKQKEKMGGSIPSHQCEICGGKFTIYTKSKHNKSKKHRLALLLTPEQQEKIKNP